MVVQFFQRHHRQVDIVFFEAEKAGGIVHEDVGVQHEKLGSRCLGGFGDVQRGT